MVQDFISISYNLHQKTNDTDIEEMANVQNRPERAIPRESKLYTPLRVIASDRGRKV